MRVRSKLLKKIAKRAYNQRLYPFCSLPRRLARIIIRFLSTTHERCNSRRPEGRQFTAIANSRTHSVQFTHAFACRTINIRAPSRTRPRAISRLCLWQLSRTAKRYFHSSLCGAHIPTNVGFHPLAVRADFTRALARISPDAVPRTSLRTHPTSPQAKLHARLCVPYNKYTRALPHALARNIPPLRAYPLSPTGVYPLTTTHERCNSRRPEGRQFTAIANSRTHSVQFTHAFACISSRLLVFALTNINSASPLLRNH